MTLKDLIEKKEELNSKITALMEPVNFAQGELATINEQITIIINEPVQHLRTTTGKDTGTVEVLIQGVMVKSQVPKVVKWDQSKLEDIRHKIREHNDDPDAYMKTKIAYTIDEKAYKDFPAPVKAVFADAREVKAGPPKITFDTNWR